jgi:hypothetical protein
MRLRTVFIAFLVFALPAVTYAQRFPFFGPIIPQDIQECAAGWGAVLVVVNNIIFFLITLLVVFIAPLIIAWAGFLLVAYSVNPGGKERARSLLLNLVIGLVIALVAWLVVNMIMTTLVGQINGRSWYEIVTTGGASRCLNLTPQALPTSTTGPVVGGGGGTTSGVPSAPPGSTSTRTHCSTADLTSTFGTAAAAMSCATLYENAACNPSAPSGTDRTLDNRAISIGLFQVNLSTNNLNYPSCQQAVGASGPLNCTQVFSGPFTLAGLSRVSILPGRDAQYETCVRAASDIQCNLDAAKVAYNDRISNGQSPLSAWGVNARNNCSSLMPSPAPLLTREVPTLWQRFVSMVSLSPHL